MCVCVRESECEWSVMFVDMWVGTGVAGWSSRSRNGGGARGRRKTGCGGGGNGGGGVQ